MTKTKVHLDSVEDNGCEIYTLDKEGMDIDECADDRRYSNPQYSFPISQLTQGASKRLKYGDDLSASMDKTAKKNLMDDNCESEIDFTVFMDRDVTKTLEERDIGSPLADQHMPEYITRLTDLNISEVRSCLENRIEAGQTVIPVVDLCSEVNAKTNHKLQVCDLLNIVASNIPWVHVMPEKDCLHFKVIKKVSLGTKIDSATEIAPQWQQQWSRHADQPDQPEYDMVHAETLAMRNQAPNHSSKRKLATEDKLRNQSNQALINSFWVTNYDLESTHQIGAGDVYDHFLSINTNTDISFVEFKTCSGRVSDLRTKVVKQQGEKTYLVHPLTTQSLNFHRNLYHESTLDSTLERWTTVKLSRN